MVTNLKNQWAARNDVAARIFMECRATFMAANSDVTDVFTYHHICVEAGEPFWACVVFSVRAEKDDLHRISQTTRPVDFSSENTIRKSYRQAFEDLRYLYEDGE